MYLVIDAKFIWCLVIDEWGEILPLLFSFSLSFLFLFIWLNDCCGFKSLQNHFRENLIFHSLQSCMKTLSAKKKLLTKNYFILWRISNLRMKWNPRQVTKYTFPNLAAVTKTGKNGKNRIKLFEQKLGNHRVQELCTMTRFLLIPKVDNAHVLI